MAYKSRRRPLSCEQFEQRLCLSAVAFAEHVIDDIDGGRISAYSAGRRNSAIAADLDGDGDLEVLSMGSECSPSLKGCVGELAWQENFDGRGDFGFRDVIGDYRWAYNVADIDGDGDLDILSWHDRSIVWIENTDGFGDFSETHIIATGRVLLPLSVADVADADGDGDLDVLSELWGVGMVWFENSDGQGTFSEPHLILTTAVDIGELYFKPRSMTFADVDGDSDMDVVWSGPECERVTSIHSALSASLLVWHENLDGQGDFGPPMVVNDRFVGESLQAVVDVDGDGDMDVVSNSRWYETDGDGLFRVRRSVRGFNHWPVRVADVDGDGDVDFLGHGRECFALECTLVWHENTDGKGTFDEEPHIIATAVDRDGIFSTPVPADLDGDGDVDVLSTVDCLYNECVSKVIWYENLSGEFEAGDANGDFQFDQLDIVQVLQSTKYLTGEPATFEEGDWNGDGVFDQLDIAAALQTGNYLQEAAVDEAIPG